MRKHARTYFIGGDRFVDFDLVHLQFTRFLANCKLKQLCAIFKNQVWRVWDGIWDRTGSTETEMGYVGAGLVFPNGSKTFFLNVQEKIDFQALFRNESFLC